MLTIYQLMKYLRNHHSIKVKAFVSKFDLKYNQVYELMYKNGLSIHEQRLCQPYGDDQKNGLDQFKALEYDTWSKVVNRVNRR